MIAPAVVLVAALAVAAEPPLPLVADASLDPTTGLLAVTLRSAGTAAVRVEASSLHRPRASYAFRLVPLDAPPGVGERDGSVRAAAPEPAPTPGSVEIAGEAIAGYAFPVWEAGFWGDFPACFDLAPRWRIEPAPALAVPGAPGRPEAVRGCAERHGFVLDRAVWERLQHLRWK